MVLLLFVTSYFEIYYILGFFFIENKLRTEAVIVIPDELAHSYKV